MKTALVLRLRERYGRGRRVQYQRYCHDPRWRHQGGYSSPAVISGESIFNTYLRIKDSHFELEWSTNKAASIDSGRGYATVNIVNGNQGHGRRKWIRGQRLSR